MKRACLALLAVALAAPGAAVANDTPGPPNATSIAAALCIAEFKQLGEAAFKAKYATKDACMQQHMAQAEQIAASCQSAPDPKACVRSALGLPSPGSPGEGQQSPMGNSIAAALCIAEFKQLGETAFKAKYPTKEACMQAHAAQAAQIAASCKSAPDPKACIRSALGLPGDSHGRGPQKDPASVLVPKVAAALCRAQYKALGAEGFTQKYGSLQGCMQQTGAQARAIVKAAIAKCTSAQDKTACLQAALAQVLGLPAPASKK